jgi:hypothetical protein
MRSVSALLGGLLSLVFFAPFLAGLEDTAGEALAGGLVGFIATLILSPI